MVQRLMEIKASKADIRFKAKGELQGPLGPITDRNGCGLVFGKPQ